MNTPDPGVSPVGTSAKRFPLLLPVLVLVLAALAALGIVSRERAVRRLTVEARQSAVPVVAVTHPAPPEGDLQIALPGETQAYTEAPIYAQANGYLKSWSSDIGARVKAGDILGEIDTPALDQQRDQAVASLKQAQAALVVSQTNYIRYQELLKNKVIAQQDYDTQAGDYQEKQAEVANAEATLRQIEALQTFKTIRAPFDGIVSARNTDIGALISSSSSTPLFTVSRVDPLRVYVDVPQTIAASVLPGTQAEITFDTFPGRKFPAEVASTSGVIDPKTRTMLVQLSLPNADDKLLPGSYATVRFKVPDGSGKLLIPANTLLFRSEGAAVGIVGTDGKVEIRPIVISRDLGNMLEIAGGLTPSDQVILNPSDSLQTGDVVSIVTSPEHPAAKVTP